ncbi:hypothetical protein [Granulicoccus sp. GXG6511]|uniref:hypothetical protein n=1 Tax=Granulicoccus sp. GXG6511 TaxID=3381351 RepID=UPI003D7C976D
MTGAPTFPGAAVPRPGPGSTAPPSPEVPTHPEVHAALADLAKQLSDLPLAEHHDRYVAVLEMLHGVLDADAT